MRTQKKRGRPLGEQPKSHFITDLDDKGVAAELHKHCRDKNLDRNQIVEEAIREYFQNRSTLRTLEITIKDDVHSKLCDFSEAAWGANVGVLLADAFEDFLPRLLVRNELIAERFYELQRKREKRPLTFPRTTQQE